MKPTQQEIIDLAREHATRYTNRHYPDKPVFTFTQDALQKVIELALERFGAGGGEPVAWMNDEGDVELNHKEWMSSVWQPLYTAPQPANPAEQEPVAWLNPYGGVVQVRATGHEKEHFTIPLYTHPSPTDLRAEYLRGLEDAAKVCDEYSGNWYAYHKGAEQCAASIRALKGKQ